LLLVAEDEEYSEIAGAGACRRLDALAVCVPLLRVLAIAPPASALVERSEPADDKVIANATVIKYLDMLASHVHCTDRGPPAAFVLASVLNFVACTRAAEVARLDACNAWLSMNV
jgi:hypothetical protein